MTTEQYKEKLKELGINRGRLADDIPVTFEPELSGLRREPTEVYSEKEKMRRVIAAKKSWRAKQREKEKLGKTTTGNRHTATKAQLIARRQNKILYGKILSES